MEQAARLALEDAITALQAVRNRQTERAGGTANGMDAREHAQLCRHSDQLFRRIFRLLSPRMRQLTRRYGLDDMPDDAAQACAIGVLRAAETYDDSKASFSTHVTWAMRGELQSLRHRVRLDQRDSARAAGVRTTSLSAAGPAGSPAEEALQVVDEAASDAVERSASDYLAGLWLGRLTDAALDTLKGSPIAASFRKDAEAAVSYWLEGPSGSRQERERQRQTARRIGRYCQAGAANIAGLN